MARKKRAAAVMVAQEIDQMTAAEQDGNLPAPDPIPAPPIAVVEAQMAQTETDKPVISRYAEGGAWSDRFEDDGGLPLADLDNMDEQALRVYGARNLNIDLGGKTAAQMRETLRLQIGRNRAGVVL